jgi:DNA-binding NarL/FixJ family response regulator
VRRKASKTSNTASAGAAATAKASPEKAAVARPTKKASTPAAKSATAAPRLGDAKILALKAEGLSNRAVAERLGIGPSSVQRAVDRQRATETAGRPALVDVAA